MERQQREEPVDQRIVTREELHRLVWTRRMGDVADDLKVSTNELAVLIETLDVPFPLLRLLGEDLAKRREAAAAAARQA
jgi:hypothetical protein